VLVAVVAAGLSVAALPASPADKEPRIRAMRAVADSYVTESNRLANFGGAARLLVDGSPLSRAYVRFRTKYLHGDDVKQVNLLVFSRRASRRGFRVRLVTGRWLERGITYENAPRLSTRFVASGPVRAKVWKAVDVTPLVDREHQEVSFALTTVAASGLELASRESGLTGPRVVVELETANGGGGPGPDLPDVPPER
jgi:hypothetical protein